jgi:hypothetical protein
MSHQQQVNVKMKMTSEKDKMLLGARQCKNELKNVSPGNDVKNDKNGRYFDNVKTGYIHFFKTKCILSLGVEKTR